MKTKHVLIAALAVIVALVIGFIFILRSQRTELEEEKAVLVNQQRDIMEEELTKLAAEYDIQYKKLSAGQG